MNRTVSSPAPRQGNVLRRLLFPPLQVRFAVAMLVTFFPNVLLYSLVYPAGEVITLGLWVWVFPSNVAMLTLGLVFLIPVESYGYYCFNLICVILNVSIAGRVSKLAWLKPERLSATYRLARFCMFVTLFVAFVQAVTDPFRWMAIFPQMSLEPGRGAGFKMEPSQLAGPLCLYLAMLMRQITVLGQRVVSKKLERQLSREGLVMMLLTIVLTRSFSVLIIVCCFLPAIVLRRSSLMVKVGALLGGAVVGMVVLGDRINEAVASSSGSMTDLITQSVGSWRNIPDILVLSNVSDFLLPGNPAEVRIKITNYAIQISPALSWVQNTFSTFSAGAVTAGVLATGVFFIAGILWGLKRLPQSTAIRWTWLMLYATGWFFVAKWDPSVWIALGMMVDVCQCNRAAAGMNGPGLDCSRALPA